MKMVRSSLTGGRHNHNTNIIYGVADLCIFVTSFLERSEVGRSGAPAGATLVNNTGSKN
jgi:hypothetical protein